MNNKRINPFFELDGVSYEFKKTRALECEYERITKNSSVETQDQENIVYFQKLQSEYQEINEKFENAKEQFFNDPLNAEKERIYNVFEKLNNKKYAEVVAFVTKENGINNSVAKVQNLAYNNGVKIFKFALCEQYKKTQEQANEIWEKFFNTFESEDTAREWILYMANNLFDKEDEEDINPFLKQARVREQQKLETRKGLAKINK